MHIGVFGCLFQPQDISPQQELLQNAELTHGSISQEEFAVALTQMGVSLTEVELEVVYAYFDRDGSGMDYGDLGAGFAPVVGAQLLVGDVGCMGTG